MDERREGSEIGALRWSDKGKLVLLNAKTASKQNKVNEMRVAEYFLLRLLLHVISLSAIDKCWLHWCTLYQHRASLRLHNALETQLVRLVV